MQFNLEELTFRRQFLLGPRIYSPNQFWTHYQFKRGLYLSVHKDLPYTTISQGHYEIALIGIAIEPNKPDRSEAELLQSFIFTNISVKSLIDSTWPLVGRWVIIFQNEKDTYLFTDPCGYRQVFYFSEGDQKWCASQPELIVANHQMKLNTDEHLLKFLLDPLYAQKESSWVGNKTIYHNCYHLMPNNYLSLQNLHQTRFFPKRPIKLIQQSKVIEQSCSILQNTMNSLSYRYEMFSLALTSGWDSRVLLAASKNVRQHINFFVYKQSYMSNNHPDLWVPKKIAKKLKLNFQIKSLDTELPGWFISLLSKNVTCAPILPKTQNVYAKLLSNETQINVNGNVSEICRNFFDKYGERDASDISVEELASRMFDSTKVPNFVIEELNVWKESLNDFADRNFHLFDLLYWEQRLGNWGARYPAVQDIVIEEISPFNCRLLLETLLSTPRHLRLAPDYPIYQEMIKQMWRETLTYPVNPYTRVNIANKLLHKFRSIIPNSISSLLKNFR